MFSRLIFIIFVVGLAVVVVAGNASAGLQPVARTPDYGRFHALIIGNDDYKNIPKLQSAGHDAKAISAVLKEKYGFDVTLLLDATRYQIMSAFSRLRQKLTETDNLLIYFAGHGVLYPAADAGFWLPVDAEPDNDANWIPNSDVARYLRTIEARHIIVIADTAFAGTLTRATASALASGRERAAYIQRMNERRSRTALTSGGMEPVLDGSAGEHSVFAKAILDVLWKNDDILSGQELFNQLKRPVVINVNQTPAYADVRRAGHEGGDFLFVPASIAAPVAEKKPAGPGASTGDSALDLEFWKAIKDSDDPSMYEAYLKRFPDGTFAVIAKARLRAAPARDRAPPVISVAEKLRTADAFIELSGTVTDDSQVTELTLDGSPVHVGPDRRFNVRRPIPMGLTQATFAAVDRWGNRSQRKVQIQRLTPAQAYGVDFGSYYALVIGNDDYQHLDKLTTAVGDAKTVADVLKTNYGFEVQLLLNASRYDITAALSRLRTKLDDSDNLLVYFAGHGELDAEREEGFWMPVDAERDVDSNWLSNGYLAGTFKAMSAKHVMVVADSCYAGTLVREASTTLESAVGRSKLLARMARDRSRTALVSGSLEPVRDTGGGDHSVFAKAFLAALRGNDGVMLGDALLDKVRRPVLLNSDQSPQYSDIKNSGHDGGDFLFLRWQ